MNARLCLFGILAASALALPAAEPALSAPDRDVPRGEVRKFTFDQSKVFPGTTRDYWIYVPAQYTPDKPACVYVNQDGIQWNAPAVFDKLTNPGGNNRTPSRVWLIRPDGRKEVVDAGLRFANGVTLSPDQSLLYVADYWSHWVYSYQIQPDGTLRAKQRFNWLHVPDTADDRSADGMRVDRDGRLYVATSLGIQVCDQAGRVNCIIPTPNKRITNLCFGGANGDTLYATCVDKVYKRKVKTRGVQASAEPLEPSAPRL